IVYLAFSHYGMWLSFILPAGTLVANYASITSFRMIFEEREKRKVRKTFERYVSPGVIALMEKNPKKYFKTGGESQELTVMFSDMGSSKRFSWTVMGDNVNLASRLEGITKEYHVQCVVSEATYRAAKEQYVFREIDRIKVKGKTVPVTIYELLDWTRNESFYTERIVRFSEALTAYRRQEWHEAIDLFSKIKAKFSDDGPAETFIRRSQELMDVPPEPDWDGVYAMKTK